MKPSRLCAMSAPVMPRANARLGSKTGACLLDRHGLDGIDGGHAVERARARTSASSSAATETPLNSVLYAKRSRYVDPAALRASDANRRCSASSAAELVPSAAGALSNSTNHRVAAPAGAGDASASAVRGRGEHLRPAHCPLPLVRCGCDGYLAAEPATAIGNTDQSIAPAKGRTSAWAALTMRAVRDLRLQAIRVVSA